MIKPLNVSTMNIRKIFIVMMILLISCPIGIIAQTSYYYYKGEKIPLTVNNDKVCVSILKNKRIASKEFLRDINVLDTIKDADFDISIIQQSDLKKLSASNFWIKEAKSILLSPSYRTKEGKEVSLTPYLSVRLKRKQDFNTLSSYAERYRLRIVRNDSIMPLWYILSVTPESGKNSLEVANALWESGDFVASSPDLSSKISLFCADDPKFNVQWGLYNSYYPGMDISVCDAWNYSTGNNIKIAIVDYGIDQNNLDLRDNIIDSLSYNTENGISPYTGFYGSHGTHCAGIAAAIKDNNIDIAGVAPDAKLMPIVYDGYRETAYFQHYMACGIKWAYEHGADIISSSWGCSKVDSEIDEAISDAFRYGRNGKGCVIVFATGNDSIGCLSYPANCNDTILAVGAIDSTGTKPTFSQHGEGLDLVAPGVKILSTIPNHPAATMSGTSMACPHVAGVAALVLQRNPELTVTQVNSIICRNAKKLSHVAFNETKPDGTWSNEYGYGLVDAYNSVINTPHVVYIQNDTITGTEIISADSIYVGKDVTVTKEKGDVVLGQGDIRMKAKSVIIRNSTTVPLGTKLIINNP